MKPTFYDAVKHIEHHYHYSDLYLLATQESWQLMKEYGKRGELFRDNIDHKLFYDIPFAYQPYWDEVERKHAARKAQVLA